ncbi:unnamed protein product [Rotaria socialis]|uniref:TMC domain-containing protein n=1 Tax=Rotaria socialis TaxID=392032 RepID=A0A821DVE6_9BILA|nr:unnamed protein product [Rotaria socialis]CAF4215036.1 unnamed protein product [Rotaria socialis]CAF4627040.1 unnamed protein product [Rotaria socialis]
MTSSESEGRKKRHRQRRQGLQRQRSEEIETIDLADVPSIANSNNSQFIVIPTPVEESESSDTSPLLEIIKRKKRKEWAKVVAPVDGRAIDRKTESVLTQLSKLFSKIPSPIGFLLDFIEHRNGYTIRSYFQFVVWLFYLNIFTFILCFTCIIMPTLIYPKPTDFSIYAMDQYYQINNISKSNESLGQCTLNDPRCIILNTPLLSQKNESNDTCLNDSFTAGSCCSLHAEAFFVNSSSEGESDWRKFLSDLIDGTGFFTLNRMYIGYYRNLTKSGGENSYFQTYNMGLAVFLTIFACLLITGIIIIRKYGDGMKTSYVQSETFQNNIFQYVFARWDYSINNKIVVSRHEQRFKTEIKNILLECNDKVNFKFDRAVDKIWFQIQRIGLWIITLIMFAGAVAAIYFTNRFAFQERAKKEINNGASQTNRLVEMAIEYLPSAVVSVINLVSQLIFAFMKDFKLYTRTTSVRHYLTRVILMRLVLLFTFVFIIILQITCNTNECGMQSELVGCDEIKGQETFIHCWETLIGQVIYRLVITDTVVMLVIHLVVDPLRSLLTCCCASKTGVMKNEDEATIDTTQEPPTRCFLCQSMEFELEDYVLDLTYTQALCWHGLLFCPFLPLVAAFKNVVIFIVKLLSLALFRKRSGLELSPARACHMFTSVLLFSFVWALLPVSFLATSLRPSRGCGPFRLYSHEPDFYIYYSIRNIITQIKNEVLTNIILKISSAVVIIPLVLILILLSCILSIRRNSYRAASIELYKLLHSSHKTHQLAVKTTLTTTTEL